MIRKILPILALSAGLSTGLWAQAPAKFNYQGIARNGSGSPIAAQALGMRLTVLDGGATGTPVYVETQTAVTNAYGLYNVQIGSGIVLSGNLSTVAWSTGNKFLKVEIDPAGGANYATIGTSQLLSVPYALNAASATLTLTGNSLSAGGNSVTLPTGGGVSGTAGYLPKFATATTLGNSGLFETNNRVGLGTAAPAAKLDVEGAVSTDSMLIFAGSAQPGADDGLGLIHAENSSTTTLTTASPTGIVGAATGSTTVPIGTGIYGVGSLVGLNAQGQCNTYATTGVFGVYGVGYAQGTAIGVYGSAGSYTSTPAGIKYAIYGAASTGGSTNYAGYFAGNVQVVGSISKAAGTFKIDHPLDPANKYLYHSFVESPDMMNIYNGNTTTDASGFATITMPDYFDALNKDFRYQLTAIGTFAQAIVKEEMNGNTFVIQTSQPNVKVSWQVTGVRNDKYANAHRVVPEVAKEEENKGKYLHPLEWGQPATSEINYELNHPVKKLQTSGMTRN